MYSKLLLLFILASVTIVVCEHLVVGDVTGKQIIHHMTEKHMTYFLKKRVKNAFYSDPNQRIITGIVAYDNLHSKASANITTGGIGYSYVNIRMKSERGMGLDYDIGIYA